MDMHIANLTINLSANWSTPLSAAGDCASGYTYPQKPTRFMRESCCGPAIYRWRVQPASIPTARHVAMYIGSSRSFPRRLREELMGSGRSGQRLKAKLDKAKKDHQGVFLDMLMIHSLTIDFPNSGRSQPYHLSQQDLSDPFLRVALEYLLLSAARRIGHTILNQATDLRAELARSLLEQLPPSERREVIRKVARRAPVGRKRTMR